jgi:hypothetical protein
MAREAMHPVSRPIEPLLEALSPVHGPLHLIGRFFLALEVELRTHGVQLHVASPASLLQANRDNRRTWLPLVPMFDETYHSFDDSNFVAILGINAAGDVVTANAIRLYDWRNMDLAHAARTLRLMYEDPKNAQPEEACRIPIASAHRITGKVAFSGAAWVRDDYRNRGLGSLLPYSMKLLGFTLWRPDVTFGLMHLKVHLAGFAPRFGFTHAQPGVMWVKGIHGDAPMSLAWVQNDDILAHAQHLLASDTPLLRVTRDRRRDQKILGSG